MLMNNTVFGNIKENVKKNKDIKLVTAEARRNYLTWKQNYHPTKYFSANSLAIELFMKRPNYLGLSMLKVSKVVINNFCYD